jgi:hypothetical protein
MSNSEYNKITSTIDSISRDHDYSPDSNNLICIDTSNSRIGINTLDPLYSLHISGGTLFCPKIITSNLSVIKINGLAYFGSFTNIVSDLTPSNNNTYKLGTVDKSWSNVYIRDLSVISIDISKNMLPLRNNNSTLGSSLYTWKTIFADDLSVNTINSLSINFLTNNGRLLDISKGQIYAKTISAEIISSNSNIILYDISLATKINTIINRVNSLSTSFIPISIIKTGFYGSFDITFNFNPPINETVSFQSPTIVFAGVNATPIFYVSDIQISLNTIPGYVYSSTVAISNNGNNNILTITNFTVRFEITNTNRFLYETSKLTKVLLPNLVFRYREQEDYVDYTTTTIGRTQNIDPGSPMLDDYGKTSTIIININI